jgi:MFS family permease
MGLTQAVFAVLGAKTARTFGYGFLGILFPVYLADLGVSASGIGVAVTLTLVASSVLTWGGRRPAERWGGRRVLLALTALTALAALLLLVSRDPRLVVLAAMIGNVAVGTGETGPFLTLEQVLIARAAPASRRTGVLSIYNLVGYAAGALGAATVAFVSAPATLFGLFLAGAVIQALAYWRLPESPPVARGPAAGRRASGPLIRRLAAVFALDSFAGGFVLQSLVAYFLHVRYGLSLEALGYVFFTAQILTAASLLLAPRAAARFGLLATMVVSHAISNVFLVAIAFAPTAALAVAFLFLRQLLSQMDVPTRQAWVMAIVEDHEREAAAAATNLARTVAAAATPALTGWVMQVVALSAPFALGGLLKMVYDLLLWTMFRHVKLTDSG